MRVDFEKLTGCRAVALGYMAPAEGYGKDEMGTVALICGDRKLELQPLEAMALKYPRSAPAYKMQKIADFAADAACGFCVACPNRLRIVDGASE